MYTCKSKFHVCYHFLDIYENLRIKNFINPSCPKLPKIIEIKSDVNFYFHTSLWCLWRPESLHKTFWSTKKKCENKKFMSFPPVFGIKTTRVKTMFFELLTCATFISLLIEIYKNRTWSMKTNLVCYKLTTLIYFQDTFHDYSITKCS